MIDSSRRRFLAGSVAAIAFSSIPIYKARAEWITTAITVVKFAISASEMFKKTPTSNSNRVLLRMIGNLSRQLDLIQSGMQLILKDIAEVRALIGDLPTAVVDELSTANLQGAVVAYKELLGVRSEYKNNERKFRRERSAEINTLIDQIRQHRNILISYENTLNVPILATALSIEYGAMMLAGESENRIRPVMSTYSDYFRRVLYDKEGSLEDQIKDLRIGIEEERAKLFKPSHESVRNRRWQRTDYYYMNFGYSMYRGELIEITPPIEELISLGLIDKRERRLNVSIVEKTKFSSRNTNAVGSGPMVEWTVPRVRPARSFPTRTARNQQIKAERDAIDKKHNANIDRLYASVSAMHAGSRALSFTQRFVV
ncbi:MAG: hypothetical protein ABJN65_05895 [Parasphingorhabdus sp.]